MTVSSATRKAGPFVGSNTVSVFPFAFKVFTAADVYVVKLNTNTETESVLVLNTDYTVSLNADQHTNPGGTVALSAGALAAGYKLTVTSNIAALQQTDLTNQGGFYPSVINNALDKLTILVQQALERLGRGLSLPLSSNTNIDTELPVPVASNLIAWNETADGLQSLDPQGLATIVAFGTAKADVYDGDGVTTEFPLTNSPGALNNLDVSVDGLTQIPGLDYTWAGGASITFTAAPAAGTDNVLVRYLQGLPQSGAQAGPYTPGGVGAVETTIQSKLAERISVKDFGAVGDNAADDTAAIQAAIDYAETLVLQQFQSGATVFFPAGTYKITSGLTVAKDNVGLAGDSVAASVITAVSPTFDLITFSKGGGTAIYRAAVRDLRLLATGNASAGSLLKLDTVYHSTVDNISLDGGYIGLTCDGCGKLIVNNLDTHQTSRSTGTPSHAVNLASTLARNSDVHFTNFQFYFQTGSTPNYAMNIDGADGIYLTSGHMHGGVSFTPSNSGVEVTCASVFFDNVYFDRSPQHHVYLTGAASNAYRNIRFVNCTFRDANRGIYQDSTTTLERLLVSACAFYTHAHSAIQLTTSDPVGAVITGCQFGENSSPTAMVQLNGSNHIISDSAFNGGSGSSGVLFGASCSNSIIADCNFAGCTATVPITNSGTGNVDKSTYAAGTYTATALGVSGTVNGTVGYAKDGNRVTLDFPTISGTSDATTFSLTGGPNAIKPLANRFVIVRAQDNGGAYVPAVAQVGTNGVVTIYANLSGGTFTASGTKSIGAGSVSYLL
jgi:hypothetical protein